MMNLYMRKRVFLKDPLIFYKLCSIRFYWTMNILYSLSIMFSLDHVRSKGCVEDIYFEQLCLENFVQRDNFTRGAANRKPTCETKKQKGETWQLFLNHLIHYKCGFHQRVLSRALLALLFSSYGLKVRCVYFTPTRLLQRKKG